MRIFQRTLSARYSAPLGYAATLLGVLLLWASLHVGSAPALSERSPAIHALATMTVLASGAAFTFAGFRALTARAKE